VIREGHERGPSVTPGTAPRTTSSKSL